MTSARAFVIALLFVSACGKSDPAPPRPTSGSPVAVEALSFETKENGRAVIDVRAYNFSDHAVTNFLIMARFRDRDGKLIQEAGKDLIAFTGAGGGPYVCGGEAWCTFKIKTITVPAATKQIELTMGAVGSATQNIDEWKSPGAPTVWPAGG